MIVVVAVFVAVAVQLVVLFIIADQIGQREPIVRSDEIDARVWDDAHCADKDRDCR